MTARSKIVVRPIKTILRISLSRRVSADNPEWVNAEQGWSLRRQMSKPSEDAGSGVEPTPGAEAAPAANKSVTAERRQLTVASCELLLEARGSMDPEDLREIVRSYQGCVADTARRYDAFVANTH